MPVWPGTLLEPLMTVKDTSTSISTFKEKLKKHLLCKQALGDGSNWIETNFVN